MISLSICTQIHKYITTNSYHFVSHTMRDQPFKKYFPSERSLPRQNYKYPTYQHYYQAKPPRQKTEPSSISKSQQVNSETIISNSPQPKNSLSNALNKKPSRSNLKIQLENLKLEVHKIMQKKQGLLRSPIEKKTFGSDKWKLQLQRIDNRGENINNGQEISDTQSVSSQKILNQPLKRLELKKTTENYDHSKYMQLQNNLLKTQLRNLKNKYISKKRELNQKCDALQKKVGFLQNSLYQSQQTLATQISTLKESLKDATTKNQNYQIPTSDKLSTPKSKSMKGQGEESDVIKQKLQNLYEELSIKNNSLYQKDNQIQILTDQSKEQQTKIQNLQQKIKQLKKDAEDNKQLLAKASQRLQNQLNKVAMLEDQIENYNLRSNQNSQTQHQIQKKYSQFQEKINRIRKQYECIVEQAKQQLEEVKKTNQKLCDQKIILEQDVKFQKTQNFDYKQRIQQLNFKIKNEKNIASELQQKYSKIIQSNQKQHKELLKSIQQKYITTPKRDGSMSEKKSSSKKGYSGDDMVLQREVKKWKTQYKLLKERYEAFSLNQNKHKNQLKQYYRGYREYKQKVDVYTQKIKLLEKQFEKYLNILSVKQSQLIKKQIQVRRVTNEFTIQKSKYVSQISSLSGKNKLLQEKYNEQVQKHEKQMIYRRQIQQKIVKSATDQSIKEIVQRMKKRLIQQDQKMSKNVKQIKNKEALNIKLKQELREIMENLEKKMFEDKNKEIKEIIDTYTSHELETFKIWRQKSDKQLKIFQSNSKNLLEQIQTFKQTINEKDQQILRINNELKLIIHSYNTKTIQMGQQLQMKDNIIQQYIERLQEANTIKNHIQNLFKDEIYRKQEQISNLRGQIITKISPYDIYGKINPSFDQILKNHMETSNKLREDVNKKTQEMFKLRDNYSALRSQYQNLKSEIQINKLKTISQKKNLQVNFQIELQNIKNQLNGQQKKVASAQQKIKLIIDENKKKDSFIQTYIMGKKLTQSQKDLVVQFIKQYQITLGSKDIIEKLQCDSRQIQKLNLYNQNLMKEMAILKQKLIIFEMIDQDKVSLYESKISKYSKQSSSIREDVVEEIQPKIYSQTRLKKAGSMQDFTFIEHQFS